MIFIFIPDALQDEPDQQGPLYLFIIRGGEEDVQLVRYCYGICHAQLNERVGVVRRYKGGRI